ncbi:hypothetical protein HDU97_002775 [Phlyctochytrium planicorne]|nr:hypothetical protein HDU97_002775 [Phlyctochytrium planicorne]
MGSEKKEQFTQSIASAIKRRHTDAAKLVFYVTALLAIYHWRYGSFLQVIVSLLACISSAPNQFAVRVYQAFMSYPYKNVLEFVVPPTWAIVALTEPMRWIFPVKTRGTDNIPRDHTRILFVGNHQLYAFDIPIKFAQIYMETGVYVRGLADRIHFIIPFWRHFLVLFGGVNGSRENCSALMEANQPILVYPGGASEVFKRKDEDPYGLKWKQRSGFARMAAEHKYIIIPFASIGIADALSIAFQIPARFLYAVFGDERGSKKSPCGEKEEVLPIIYPFLRPQTNYIWFGEPIDATPYHGGDDAKIFELREKVRVAVEGGLKECLEWQKEDKERFHSVPGAMWKSLIALSSGKKEKNL